MGGAALPVVVWSAHFMIIYGFTAFACARQLATAVPWVIVAASLLAVVGLVALGVPAGRRAMRAFQLPDFLAAGLGALAAIAVIWEASSLLSVPACV